MPSSAQDLARQLLRGGAPQIAVLLRRVPALVDALLGRGPLAPAGGITRSGHAPAPTIQRLALVLTNHEGIGACIVSLDRIARQLLHLAVWHGGSVTRAQALAEAGPDAGPVLDTAASTLAEVMLTDPRAGWCVLRPGVAAGAGLPGIRAADGLRYQSDAVLTQIARGLGEPHPPSSKPELLAEITARLAQPDAIAEALHRLSSDAIRCFEVLLNTGPQRVRDLGIGHFVPWQHPPTPLHELERAGLIAVEPEAQWCSAWLDILVGLSGSLYASWEPAPPRPTQPLREPAGLPAILGRLASLLALWEREPAPALQDGGLGVRPVRAAAKALGLPPGEVGLLACLAADLGLLAGLQTGSKGRGRAAVPIWVWTSTSLAAAFAELPAQRRWALLVQAWRDCLSLDERDGLPERVDQYGFGGVPLLRSGVLRALADQPPGTGLSAPGLADLVVERLGGMLWPEAAVHVVAALRVLGLVPPDGPVGLTALARALLEGLDALDAALPAPRMEFTVQSDRSVVAPPDLAPDVGARLERYADLESASGARLYRLSEHRIAAALDAGETAEQILGFLSDHSTAPPTQNVEYMVNDCARRHGRVRAGSCASYVRSDDAALLSRAVGVKAARLRLLAPTVAVSALPSAKVVQALRAKGLMPVGEDAEGGVVLPSPQRAPSGRRAMPVLRDGLEPTGAVVDDLVAALMRGPADPVAAAERELHRILQQQRLEWDA